MKRLAHLFFALLVGFAAIGPSAAADPVSRAIAEGHPLLDVRYRYERVDQVGFARDAEASTIRLRAGYETGTAWHFSALIELEATATIGAERYNSTANGLTDFPAVFDPEDEEVNQIFLAYAAPLETTLRLGRQRINLDNQRFIGAVGWRQLEQTYDGLSAAGRPSKRLAWFYAHLNNANRIFGEHHPDPARADLDLDADLFNVSWSCDFGKAVAYGYLLGIDDAPTTSHRDLGLRFDGSRELSERWKLLYTGEYTWQDDYDDGAAAIDVEYARAEVGARYRWLTLRVGRERLEGNGTWGFATPLATLHGHNGWADQFLATPADGLIDAFVGLDGKFGAWSFATVWHDFEADRGGASYGTELDVQLRRTLGPSYSASLKYAEFASDGFAADVEKLWVVLGFRL